MNATIKACDPLDGRADGVISRTDLCMLDCDLSSIIGEEYYCAASSTSSGGPGGSSSSSYQPVQSGKVSKEGVAVVKAIYGGLHNSKGQRAYISRGRSGPNSAMLAPNGITALMLGSSQLHLPVVNGSLSLSSSWIWIIYQPSMELPTIL